MNTPARKHFLRMSAQTSQAAESPTRADATQYELMLHKLASDRRRLHEVQSMERKAEVKREILPEYGPWIQGVLEGNQGVQDDVLMTVMVWNIDTGNLDDAIKIASYAIEHKLSMPDQYKRTTATLIAEEVAETAIKAIAAKQTVDANALINVGALTEAQDMPDEVRAKLYKAIGYALQESDKPSALEYLIRALNLHDKVGVKKDIEKLERDIKNAAKSAAETTNTANAQA